jgi:hypothetical protein
MEVISRMVPAGWAEIPEKPAEKAITENMDLKRI